MAVWGRSSWEVVKDYSGQFYSYSDAILHTLKDFIMVQMRGLN